MSQDKNDKKGKIAYYIAWLAVFAAGLAAISNFLKDTPIPKKDDYQG
jgi:hypothetical protein